MPKDAAYHECAIRYNEALAIYAESLIESLENPEVAGWAAGVAKQHRFHLERHQTSLEKLQNGGAKKNKNKRRRNNKKKRLAEAAASAAQPVEDEVLSPEEMARLDAQIDRIHGAGAAAALDAAFADGSIFSDSSRDVEPVSAAGDTPSDPYVVEIQPGVTRPMTEQERAEYDAAEAQEVTSDRSEAGLD